MRENGVYKIGSEYYRVRYQDSGVHHAEDRGLYRADRVAWTGTAWRIVDDDDYLISGDRRIIARESGWELRRERIEVKNE